MTRSTLRRIIRYCRTSGTIQPGDSPILVAATVRGFVRGLAVRRRYRTVTVIAVEPAGSIAIGHGTDDAGRPIRFAGDHRMMAAIAAALVTGPVAATIASWQII